MEDHASTAVNMEATADPIESQSPFAKQSWKRAMLSLVIFWLALLLNITASYNLYITSSFVPLLVNLLGGCGTALGILEYFGVDSGCINRGLTQVIFNFGVALCYIFWNTSRDYPALYASVAVNYWCLNCVCLCTNPNQFLPLFVENPSPKAVNILLALCVLFTVQTCKESPHLSTSWMETKEDTIQDQNTFATHGWKRAMVSLMTFWLALLLNIMATYHLYMTSSYGSMLVNLWGGYGIAIRILEYFGLHPDPERVKRDPTLAGLGLCIVLIWMCSLYFFKDIDQSTFCGAVAFNFACLYCVCFSIDPSQVLPDLDKESKLNLFYYVLFAMFVFVKSVIFVPRVFINNYA